MRIGRVVVGWDGSAPAEHALQWASDAAEPSGGAIHVVRVLDPDLAAAPDEVMRARTALQDVLVRWDHGRPMVPVTAEIVVGSPADELPRIADRTGVLVIGASRSSGVRDPRARRVPIAVVGRSRGVTVVVPLDPPPGRVGVVAAVRGGAGSTGTIAYAARAASRLRESLTLVRLRDPHEPIDEAESGALGPEARSAARDFPDLTVRLDPHWIRSPISLLTRSDRASLLVLEGHRPTTAPPRFSFERWLAAQARAPFVVVAEGIGQEHPSAAERTALAMSG